MTTYVMISNNLHSCKAVLAQSLCIQTSFRTHFYLKYRNNESLFSPIIDNVSSSYTQRALDVGKTLKFSLYWNNVATQFQLNFDVVPMSCAR